MELCRVWTGVCVMPVPNYQQKHVGTCMDIVTMKRYKEEVHFRCVLSPVLFQDSVICYKDCTKQRYRSLAHYEPKSKPKIFHESIVIYPKRTEMTFVSTIDYHIDECRKWFQTTMEFKAKTYTTTKIQNMNSNFSKMNNSPNNNLSNNEWEICDFPFSPDANFGERKVGVSNGPGASLIYLPRFEKEDHIESCNFNLMNSSENVLLLEDSSEEVDVWDKYKNQTNKKQLLHHFFFFFSNLHLHLSCIKFQNVQFFCVCVCVCVSFQNVLLMKIKKNKQKKKKKRRKHVPATCTSWKYRYDFFFFFVSILVSLSLSYTHTHTLWWQLDYTMIPWWAPFIICHIFVKTLFAF